VRDAALRQAAQKEPVALEALPAVAQQDAAATPARAAVAAVAAGAWPHGALGAIRVAGASARVVRAPAHATRETAAVALARAERAVGQQAAAATESLAVQVQVSALSPALALAAAASKRAAAQAHEVVRAVVAAEAPRQHSAVAPRTPAARRARARWRVLAPRRDGAVWLAVKAVRARAQAEQRPEAALPDAPQQARMEQARALA
jgi:hypothetical protein